MSYSKPSFREIIPEKHTLFLEESTTDKVERLRTRAKRLEEQRNLLLALLTFTVLAFLLHPFFFAGAGFAVIFYLLTFIF